MLKVGGLRALLSARNATDFKRMAAGCHDLAGSLARLMEASRMPGWTRNPSCPLRLRAWQQPSGLGRCLCIAGRLDANVPCWYPEALLSRLRACIMNSSNESALRRRYQVYYGIRSRLMYQQHCSFSSSCRHVCQPGYVYRADMLAL